MALAGAVILAGAFAAARSANTEKTAASRRELTIINGLQSQQQEFVNQNINAVRLAELESRIKEYDERLVSASEFQGKIREFGPSWQFQPSNQTGPSGEAAGMLVCYSSSVADWTNVVGILTQLERISPGIGISSVSIATDGDATTRRFVRIRVGLLLRYSREAAPAAGEALTTAADAAGKMSV